MKSHRFFVENTMTCRDDDHCGTEPLNSPSWRRAPRIAFGVIAAFFLAEIIARVAAGSAALQADALDFFGDAASWPAVIVAAIMGGLGLWGGWQIVQQAYGELHTYPNARLARAGE